MSANESRDHHVVPQFYLRNFAIDPERQRVATLAKEGDMAVWMERSIKTIGYERDFYVHFESGRPVSVETDIGRRLETPISGSDTWKKIASGRADALDRSDRSILYALVRHLEARTPHYLATGDELMRMANDPNSEIAFSDEEREMYRAMLDEPEALRAMFNRMATSRFDARAYDGAMITVVRSAKPLRTSTTPVRAMKAPAHPKMTKLPPGGMPFQRVLTLNRRTLVCVIDGDFDGAFQNIEIDEDHAVGINRATARHFAHFPMVRHMLTTRDRLVEDMGWANYNLVSEGPSKIVFKQHTGRNA